MKKIIFVSIFLFVAFSFVLAQEKKPAEEITDKHWSSLFTALESENWATAFDLSEQYLELLKNDSDVGSGANLRYIYLFSAAGKVAEGKMTYEDFEKKVKDMSGKKVAMPFREIRSDCKGDLNYICSNEKEKKQVIVTATNKAGTTIFAFEYIKLDEEFDFANNDGKLAAVIGVVDSIVPNPNKSKLIIMRIYISKGEILLRDNVKNKVESQ